jgi:hypothetical protein
VTVHVKGLAVTSVRQRLRQEWTAVADAQRETVRCAVCGWYMRDVLVGDGKRAFAMHLTGARHTGRNRKSGPQAKTRDRLAGRSWAK